MDLLTALHKNTMEITLIQDRNQPDITIFAKIFAVDDVSQKSYIRRPFKESRR
jgi:hypothetical protein